MVTVGDARSQKLDLHTLFSFSSFFMFCFFLLAVVVGYWELHSVLLSTKFRTSLASVFCSRERDFERLFWPFVLLGKIVRFFPFFCHFALGELLLTDFKCFVVMNITQWPKFKTWIYGRFFRSHYRPRTN
jgi:hypothetical protein